MASISQISYCKKCGIKFSFKNNVSTDDFKEQNAVFDLFTKFENQVYKSHRKFCKKELRRK